MDNMREMAVGNEYLETRSAVQRSKVNTHLCPVFDELSQFSIDFSLFVDVKPTVCSV